MSLQFLSFDFTETLTEEGAEKMPNASVKELEKTLSLTEVRKDASAIQLKSIHIKDEPLSFENKSGKTWLQCLASF